MLCYEGSKKVTFEPTMIPRKIPRACSGSTKVSKAIFFSKKINKLAFFLEQFKETTIKKPLSNHFKPCRWGFIVFC